MKNLFNMLQESAASKPNSTSSFGNLVDGETYAFKITDTDVRLNKSGNPMMELKVETISGDTGVGTRMRTYYTLDAENPKDWQVKQLNQLLGAIGVDLPEISADDYLADLKEIAFRITEDKDEKTFIAEVKARPDYTTPDGKVYKQWAINGFSVAPNDKINADLVKTTSAEDLANDFSFDA